MPIIVLILFIVYVNFIMIKNCKHFIDMLFYETHRLGFFSCYLYKLLEMVLLTQYIRIHKKMRDKTIVDKVSRDLYYIYVTYFKINDKKK